MNPKDIRSMFDAISGRYDFLNKVLSLGRDQDWRARAVDCLDVKEAGCYIDVGCGTAALSIEIACRFGNPPGKVIGFDHSENMLNIGRKKVLAAKLESIIALLKGDALQLPLAAESADGLISGFVIRNIDNRIEALKEWARVLKPGGGLVILELSKPDNLFFLPGYLLFTNIFVPLFGLFLSRYKPYKYLIDSIKAFPPPALFMEMLRSSGFCEVAIKPLTFGVVNIYSGRKSV